MASLSSETNTSNNSTTRKIKTSAAITPPLKQLPISALISKKTWLFGGLFILFLLAMLAVVAMSQQQSKQNTAYQKITNNIQIHSQRLIQLPQQTISGNESAFEQLQLSRDELDNSITLLSHGGAYQKIHLAPLNGQTASHLSRYINNWQAKDKETTQILNNKSTLINLGNITRRVNTANNQLLNLINQLTSQIEQIGKLPNELIATEAIKVLVQNLTKSINTLLLSEFPVSEISEQLTTDRNRLSTIINALNQGNKSLQIPPLTDKTALTTIKQIQTLFDLINNHINILQKQIPEVLTTKFAAQELANDSEAFLQIAEDLNTAVQAHGRSIMENYYAVIYISAILVIITLFLFIKTFINSVNVQLQTSKKEINRTQRAILRLLDDMGKLADGDLTVRTVVTEDITGAIADSINFTIEELNSLVEGVNQSSTQVATSATQAHQVSSKLLHAAQHQSQKIEESTMAILGMAESINDVSETASESAKVAKKSLETAEKGTIAVRDSIAGMNEIRTYIQETSKRIKRLSESSQEIGEITALISDITEQTNVLALNAAIQATAAGESGRGFTVIAQEVQRLAERSAEASKQISVLVKNIQGDTKDTIAAMEKSTAGVAEGTKRSDAVGQALDKIEKVSKHLAQLVSGIFENTHKQAQAADKVVQNMEEILSITRQTTAGTKQTAVSIKKINGFATELKASVSSFKV